MSKNVSVLVAISTLGGGLIHLAVGAGAPLPLLIVFVAVGAAELAYAIVILRQDRVPAPRAFVGIALVPVAAWVATLALAPASTLPLGPLAAATLLGLASVAIVLVGLRRARDATSSTGPGADDDAATEHPWRFIGVLAVSAAIVAGVVTPALSGTWAGQFAVPHGYHDVPMLDVEEHGGH